MASLTRVDSAGKQPTAVGSRPAFRVCMHVQGTARTDVRVMREAIALVESGYAVTVVDLEKDSTRPREEYLNGVRLKHIVMPSSFVATRFKPWFLVKLGSMVIRGATAVARTPADFYHAHDDTALPACYVAARVHRKPLVFDAHELPLVQPNLTRWRRLCVLARLSLRVMLRRCTAVITVSPPIAQDLRQRYGGPTAVVVRNVPEYTQPIAGDRLRQYLGAAADTRIALYQGAFQENRSLDILVRAAAFLQPHHRIVLMGSGASQRKLEGLIAAEGVADRIKILPPVPYKDLLEWTASADLGLILYQGSYSPNVQFCLPNKLFEYLMSGVPVLATDLDAVAAILRTYNVGEVVPSLEPADIGHAITRLLGDVEGRERMQRNALLAAATDLRWDVERHNLTALYGRLPIRAPAAASRRETRGAGEA